MDAEPGTRAALRHRGQDASHQASTTARHRRAEGPSGRDWFTVLSGTMVLLLGQRTIMVETGQAAEFSTMISHAFGARDSPAEILGIFDHDGQRTHLRQLP